MCSSTRIIEGQKYSLDPRGPSSRSPDPLNLRLHHHCRPRTCPKVDCMPVEGRNVVHVRYPSISSSSCIGKWELTFCGWEGNWRSAIALGIRCSLTGSVGNMFA